MLEGGEDALYVARRLVRAASEDVGNADPQALRRALDAKEAIDFLGMPEGALALAQATVYMAAAPKSNRVYLAQKGVEGDLRKGHRYPVPLQLRNAVTELMEAEGYGESYRYAHDEAEGVADMECLPDKLAGRVYYSPKESGFETRIREWLALWRERRERAARRERGRTP
jgi:putative ATPase